MPERKAWTPEQDRTLKMLREEFQINKWSIIAKKMADEYDMPGRTGKQCRERYHNHLDSSILRTEWTREEEENLYNLHDEIGNKWAIIAQKLPGRTDNSVKNHFYSRMRKAIRKLNKTIYQNFKKEYKEIKMPVLYKIVQATDQKFKVNSPIDEEISQHCCKIKNMLLIYSNDDNNALEGDLEKLKQLSNDIHDFSVRYKRKQKKQRRNSSQGEDLLLVPRFEHKGKSNSDQGSENEEDDYSKTFRSSYEEGESSYEMAEQPTLNPTKTNSNNSKRTGIEKQLSSYKCQASETQALKPPVLSIKVPVILPKCSLNVEDDVQKLEQMLKHQGILEQSQRKQTLNKMQSLRREDSYGLMMDDEGRSNNMLSQSIEGLKLSHANLNLSVQLDEENKLFVSN